jgi:hypothetical protein
MFQDEGASTARTGMWVLARAEMTGPKGSRTAPLKEKPKMASMMWSVELRAVGKSFVKGIWRSRSWVVRRWEAEVREGWMSGQGVVGVD